MDESKTVKVAKNKKGKEINEILSKSIRSGKRTYFFDLKASKNNEPYLTITESKRHFDETNGTFSYEKHKLFLLKEDMRNFHNELGNMIKYMEEHSLLAETSQTEENDMAKDQ